MKFLTLAGAAFGIGLLVAPATGCSGGDDAASACAVGSETCPCTQGGICDAGLDCRSMICVRIGGAGADAGAANGAQGGSPGSGGNGSAAGNTPGSAGVDPGGAPALPNAGAGNHEAGSGGNGGVGGGSQEGGSGGGGGDGGSDPLCVQEQPCQKPGGGDGICAEGMCGECPAGDVEDVCPDVYGQTFHCFQGTCIEGEG
jgi:hypothetical protein